LKAEKIRITNIHPVKLSVPMVSKSKKSAIEMPFYVQLFPYLR
jgi:hypothetical protein